MILIRLTAAIAVSMTLFACEQYNSAKNATDAEIPAAPTGSALADYDKTEDKKEFEYTGVSADSVDRQKSPDDKQKQKPSQAVPVVKTDWDKKIIKTASLNVEVKDHRSYYASLREKIKNLGGYIAQEEQNQSVYKFENVLAIKVPVDQFDNAVVELTGNAEKINERKITSRDVTTEMIDTKSRMEAKKQVRLRYMDLLNQAKNMQEILNVQSEINGIQEEIESAAGQIQYLGHSSTFSTINLTYYQILNLTAKDSDETSFANQLTSAFKTGWSWVGGLLIGLVSVWPLLAVLLAGILFYKRKKFLKSK